VVFAGLLPALALGLATTVAAPALADLPDSEKAAWQTRYRNLLEAESAAASRYEVAKATYSRNQKRNRRRGEARASINDELAMAQIELGQARAALDDFPAEAHRAGVPPGWLREVEDAAGAASLR
jgi:DNA-nicking Smr family endonuclease